MSISLLLLLLLIMVANGAPILMRKLFAHRFDYPLDMGKRFIDHKPLLGRTKTWRGFIASIIMTSVAALVLGYGPVIGAEIALLAMLGDVFSSFVKRRLDMDSSAMAPLLDQVPESVLPAMFMMHSFDLQWQDIAVIVSAFVILELLLSRILYKLGIRHTPY